MSILEARGLGKRYGRSWALSECSPAVPAGHVTALVGPNGAGKTTTLIGAGIAAAANGILRPFYLPPVSGPVLPGGALQAGGSFVRTDGRPLTAVLNRGLAVASNAGRDMVPWRTQHHVAWLVSYQPASRCWPLQFIEAGGLLLVSVLLAAATIGLVRHRAA